mmetsp:Transcript_49730/g.90032  ORF Transcript_49730/g.90032 Transcript_49730/m.90032 type:complete len:272 (-) Transcript_49730:1601-2416(-)
MVQRWECESHVIEPIERSASVMCAARDGAEILIDPWLHVQEERRHGCAAQQPTEQSPRGKAYRCQACPLPHDFPSQGARRPAASQEKMHREHSEERVVADAEDAQSEPLQGPRKTRRLVDCVLVHVVIYQAACCRQPQPRQASSSRSCTSWASQRLPAPQRREALQRRGQQITQARELSQNSGNDQREDDAQDEGLALAEYCPGSCPLTEFQARASRLLAAPRESLGGPGRSNLVAHLLTVHARSWRTESQNEGMLSVLMHSQRGKPEAVA